MPRNYFCPCGRAAMSTIADRHCRLASGCRLASVRKSRTSSWATARAMCISRPWAFRHAWCRSWTSRACLPVQRRFQSTLFNKPSKQMSASAPAGTSLLRAHELESVQVHEHPSQPLGSSGPANILSLTAMHNTVSWCC